MSGPNRAAIRLGQRVGKVGGNHAVARGRNARARTPTLRLKLWVKRAHALEFGGGHEIPMAGLRAGTGSIGADPRTARFIPTRFDGKGFWSIIKRGVLGTFHKVSKKYIPLYVAEFQFRHDNRMTLEKSVAQI